MNETQTITVIETDRQIGQYNMPYHRAIIDHPKHGRLYIREAYGGENTPQGGAYRWRHGLAVRLQPSDTLDHLESSAPQGVRGRIRDQMEAGYDGDRPLLPWDGIAIANLASAAGLT